MEWVKVKYWRKRGVVIDGQESGMTNKVLAVGRGRHRFKLSPPENYKPRSQIKTVRNTTPQFPLVIVFVQEDRA